jgi:hypothetical protein
MIGGALVLLATLVLDAPPAGPGLELAVEPAAMRLDGPEGQAQLVVSGIAAGDAPIDLTHDPAVRYESLGPDIAQVDRRGRVRAMGDGQTELRITRGGSSARVRVEVGGIAAPRAVSFEAEVAPIFVKRGCNSGSCHGKSSGQNGFRLSLLGFDPRFDYESIVREARGRRVFPAAPEASLLVRKPTTAVPHGGGLRFPVSSAEYRTLVRWIGQGMPYERSAQNALLALEITPAERRLSRGAGQQFRVVARHADGSATDVTALAQFQSNAPDLATIDDQGHAQTLEGVGEAAIVARFGDRVAVARLTVPLGPPPARSAEERSANLIDPLLFGQLRALGLSPSPACTDAEFARRSSLDICGVLPDPAAVAALETSPEPDKRARWVDRLLERPEYADLFAMKWSAILRNKRSLGPLSQPGTFALHDWIRQALAEDLPYDRLVSALLTARGDMAENPAVVWYRQLKTPEELVDDTAQLFLGVRLQCARCHHHPLEAWGQDDYEGLAAFFARLDRKPGSDPITPRLYLLSEDEQKDEWAGSRVPRVLGGPPAAGPRAEAGNDRDPRQDLAAWLARPDNPFFARALVNRYWKHFFGRGLVEPEDDLRASNPPSNPALLDALAADFIAHGYDLKHLVRTLATSRAYDRSSFPLAGNARDRQNFARYYPRRLPAEVLLDAIGVMTGRPQHFDGLPPSLRATQLPDDGVASAFLETFGRPRRESACECERAAEPSLAQHLLLLNSPALQRSLSDDRGRAAGLARDGRPDADKVDALYRLALARPATAEERAVCLAHLNRKRAEDRLREGFEDLIWTLVNTKEFLFNH